MTHVRAFGWLSVNHPFPTEVASESVLDTLEQAARERIWVMRGYHVSEFTEVPQMPFVYQTAENSLLLGDACLLVVDDEGQPWVAPNLVLHYVRDICYLPAFTPHLPSETMLSAIRRRQAPDTVCHVSGHR